MKNISAVKNCYGCGVCATICGRKIIEIKLRHKTLDITQSEQQRDNIGKIIKFQRHIGL